MYRLFGIFAILTLLCISSTSGHDINYQFTSISVAEGLSQSTAQSILLDKKGKLWIGTKNGLNFYTGQNLKIFKSHPNDRYSLPSAAGNRNYLIGKRRNSRTENNPGSPLVIIVLKHFKLMHITIKI